MHGRRWIRSIAALSAASLVAQPLIVLPGGCAQTRATSVVEAKSYLTVAGVGTPPHAVCPAIMVPVSPLLFPLVSVAVLPVTALSPAAIETQRGAIAQIMIELGEDENRAHQMATELSAEDLAVLLENPKMMQKAGDLALIVIVVLIVGGIVALAIAADSGSVVITT